MAVSKETQAELKLLGRRANRRLERASQGQRRALEWLMRGYHTIEDAGSLRFSQGKAKTEAEARARLAELKHFLGLDRKEDESLPISTRAGWNEAKRKAVEGANETLQKKYDKKGRKYTVTDEELATILEETGGDKSMAFYAALENVVIKKNRKRGKNKNKPLSSEELSEAIYERKTDRERVKELHRGE